MRGHAVWLSADEGRESLGKHFSGSTHLEVCCDLNHRCAMIAIKGWTSAGFHPNQTPQQVITLTENIQQKKKKKSMQAPAEVFTL